MPWVTLWVDPVPFTTHLGVTIYHTYTGAEARRGFHAYRFTTAASDADPRYYFDVRELPVAATARLDALDTDAGAAIEQAVIREIIHAAIDAGILRAEEVPSDAAEAG